MIGNMVIYDCIANNLSNIVNCAILWPTYHYIDDDLRTSC